jgi:tetratricopeptide (TPR) repeat protein
MSPEETESLVAKGIEAMASLDYPLALYCFERAIQLERAPVTCSYLAYCMAKVRGSYKEANLLAYEALSIDPENPLLYLNLGRVLSLGGNQEQALVMLRQGLQYGMHLEIIREIEAIGNRRTPVFRKLPRNHPINRFAGFVLTRVGLK